MDRKTPLIRQWTLFSSLCARRQGMTVREMAEEAGVNERTIRRDLEAFEQAGFPLEETVGAHGLKRWRIDAAKMRAMPSSVWRMARSRRFPNMRFWAHLQCGEPPRRAGSGLTSGPRACGAMWKPGCAS